MGYLNICGSKVGHVCVESGLCLTQMHQKGSASASASAPPSRICKQQILPIFLCKIEEHLSSSRISRKRGASECCSPRPRNEKEVGGGGGGGEKDNKCLRFVYYSQFTICSAPRTVGEEDERAFPGKRNGKEEQEEDGRIRFHFDGTTASHFFWAGRAK